MAVLWILLGIIVFVVIAALIIAYICFKIAFYAKSCDPSAYEESSIPEGEIYEQFRDSMEKWTNEAKQMKSELFSITTFDGLKLYGKFYEYKKGAPIELMFHGYRGDAYRDLSGGVQRCFKLEHSAFIVDQRCSKRSEGNVITFGIKEHKDCLCWVDFLIEHFGSDVKIILCGISMGAATVLMAAGNELPKNVIGVLADCGYNSPKDIIKKVIKQMKLPVDLAYFFVKLGARLYGRFNIEEYSPEQALKNCKVPVIFFHGESDDFVPCQMSQINYDACTSKKKLVTMKDAGHGLCYLYEPERYLDSLREFFA